jgi:hypothetical protein
MIKVYAVANEEDGVEASVWAIAQNETTLYRVIFRDTDADRIFPVYTTFHNDKGAAVARANKIVGA